MKVQVSFSADTDADVKKLIVTLAALTSGNTIEAEHEAPLNKPTSADPSGDTEAKKIRKGKGVKAAPASDPEFNFEDDFSMDVTEEAATKPSIDLAAIRELVNEKATAGHAEKIRSTMGSFNITKLGDLTKAQYETFYKAINNLK